MAVKVIRTELAADPEFRARFGQEVAAARKVSGLYTALVVDADVTGSVPWLATAYVPGPSLAEVVAGHGPLPGESVLALAAGLAEGLSAIHAAGLVHRDLKPSNVLMAEDGPRVIDFGISRAVEATSLTRSGFVIGSPGFMSPEQAEGREVGPASDIFSLGAVLAFAATGEGPFGAGSTAALIYRVVHGPPNLDRLSADLRPLVEHCLAKAADQRPTASDLLAQVGAVQPAPGWLPEPISRELALNAVAGTPPASDVGADRSDAQVQTESRNIPSQQPGPAPKVTAQSLAVAPDQTHSSGDGRRQRRSRRPLIAAAVIGVLAAASALAIILTTTGRHTPPATSASSSKPALPPSQLVSITLSPTTSASTDVLAAAAQILRRRAAHLHLAYTQAQVSGQDVVLTGPAADEAQLKTLAVTGVLDFRQVLLYQPYATAAVTPFTSATPSATASDPAPAASPSASSATSNTAFGDPSLVSQNTLALFNKVTCKPNDTTQWKKQAGYNNPNDYDNPAVQIVSCDSSGGKYALDVAKVRGTDIASATAELSTTSNQWEVLLTLKARGATAFANLTTAQSNKYFASASTSEDDFWLDTIGVVLDGNVVTAPETSGPIPGGTAQISGNFSRAQAQDLAAQLQSGALPVDLRVGAVTTFSSSAST